MLTHSFRLALPGTALLGLGLSAATPSTATLPIASGGTPIAAAGLAFGDVDGDGLDEVFVVQPDGRSRLFLNYGDGRFEDITLAANLGQLGGATCALFADFDGDGRADLFTGSSTTRLWRNRGDGTFEPLRSGIDHDLVDLAAQAVDHDQDGQLDLLVRTEAGDVVYRNIGEGRFQRLELAGTAELALPAPADGSDTPAELRLARWVEARATGAALSGASGAGSTSSTLGPGATCLPTIRDQNTGACLEASSLPGLGKLYPLSTQLYVSPSTGYVGMGTSTPQTNLQVGEYFVTSQDNFIELRTTGGPALWESGLKMRASNPNFGFDIVHDDPNKGLDIRRWDNDFGAFGVSGIFLDRTNGDVGIGTNMPEGGLSVTTPCQTLTPVTQGVHMGIECCGYAGSTTLEIVSDSNGSPHLDFNALGSGQNDFGSRLLWDPALDELQLHGSRYVVFGSICATGTIGACSDERFKTNVEEVDDALELLEKVRSVRYDWRSEEFPERGFGEERQIGFLAQELREVLPEAVSQSVDGYYAVDYGKVTPLLAAAVQEQQREIADLRAELLEMRAALANLERR